MTTTLSSRAFNQHASAAKRLAECSPVLIADQTRPAHVPLRTQDDERLTGTGPRIADLLAMPGIADIALEIPPRRDLGRAADAA